MSSPHSINRALCEALGGDPASTVEIDLTVAVNRLPRLMIRQYLRSDGDFASLLTVLRELHLVPHRPSLAAIAAERARAEAKYSAAHDDMHSDGELAMGAVCLAFPSPLDVDCFPPWAIALRDKHHDNRRRQLEIAGALIVAELERLERRERAEAQAGDVKPTDQQQEPAP